MGIYEDKRSIPVRYVEIDQNGYPRSPQKIPAFRIIKFGLVTLIQFFFFVFRHEIDIFGNVYAIS